jgi:hypothetical protein
MTLQFDDFWSMCIFISIINPQRLTILFQQKIKLCWCSMLSRIVLHITELNLMMINSLTRPWPLVRVIRSQLLRFAALKQPTNTISKSRQPSIWCPFRQHYQLSRSPNNVILTVKEKVACILIFPCTQLASGETQIKLDLYPWLRLAKDHGSHWIGTPWKNFAPE